MFEIVLFEDHTASCFRPLAASTPLFEIRCGMFNLRERINLLRPGGGSLRTRGYLAPLVTDPSWSAGGGGGVGRRLWLAGRLAPSCEHLAGLLAAADTGPFALRDDQGLLAVCVEGEVATELDTGWAAWLQASGAAWTAGPTEPWEPALPADWQQTPVGDGGTWLGPTGGKPAAAVDRAALGWIWQLVPRTADALVEDLAAAAGSTWRRHPFGVVPDPSAGEPDWAAPAGVTAAAPPSGVSVLGAGGLHLGPRVSMAPGAVLDTRSGPVIIEQGADIGPHVLLEGPLLLGPAGRVKAGARLYGESSFGVGNRLAGEIGESTCGDFANKQHEGFLGHAVLGSWVNLGAMSTCSDLKNNYGPVRVDLGDGARDTGQRFVGLLAGDHVKTAIGSLFNTATVVGFATNIFGGGMPPKHVPAFNWGGAADGPDYDCERALATARVVMARRGCVLTGDHERLFRILSGS